MAVVDVGALLDPEAIIFGGGIVAAQGERLVGRVRELAKRFVAGGPNIFLSTLGEDAQLLGAACLAIDRLDTAKRQS